MAQRRSSSHPADRPSTQDLNSHRRPASFEGSSSSWWRPTFWERSGSSASDAIRQALVDAVRFRRREQMRIESLALMNDEADRAESRKVLSEMDELRAW